MHSVRPPLRRRPSNAYDASVRPSPWSVDGRARVTRTSAGRRRPLSEEEEEERGDREQGKRMMGREKTWHLPTATEDDFMYQKAHRVTTDFEGNLMIRFWGTYSLNKTR